VLTRCLRTTVLKTPNVSEEAIAAALQKLRDIEHHQVGVIELADDLDIETVTEIFIRVNSKGVELSQADFAMSKIASGESYGGPLLRKAIDYFCRLVRDTGFAGRLEKQDKEFVQSEFWPAIRWLGDVQHGLLYDPTYTDVLRVVSISEFAQGRMGDLVALLSGRNLETKTYEEDFARECFAKLRGGILAFVNKTHFERFTMILRSAGFVTSDLITSRSAVNFAYVVYLRGQNTSGLSADELERLVRRWYAMSILTGRYSGSIETIFDTDIKGIEKGIREYVTNVITSELPETFWTAKLPMQMETTSTDSPYFIAFLAAQVFFKDKGFLSKTIEVEKLLSHISDKHHIFPRKYLQRLGLSRSQYNQIANLAITQSEINIAIGDRPPKEYFSELLEQVNGGPIRYGGITDMETLRENFEQNALPDYLLRGHVPDYETFLKDRRQLMAQRIKKWFESL
jgi:hypothetical protein